MLSHIGGNRSARSSSTGAQGRQAPEASASGQAAMQTVRVNNMPRNGLPGSLPQARPLTLQEFSEEGQAGVDVSTGNERSHSEQAPLEQLFSPNYSYLARHYSAIVNMVQQGFNVWQLAERLGNNPTLPGPQENTQFLQELVRRGIVDLTKGNRLMPQNCVLQEANLTAPVRKRLDNIRTLLQAQPSELIGIHMKQSGDQTELSFVFADSDRFPEPLKEEYEGTTGVINVFIPSKQVPKNLSGHKEQLVAWLQLPPLSPTVRW